MITKSWTINIHTVSEANCNAHWRVKSERHRQQKWVIRRWSLQNNIGSTTLPCTIKLTRLAPLELDEDDNLRMSVKYIKDYIADQIIPGLAAGRADGDKRIKWIYGQEKHPILKLRIEISQEDQPDLSTPV